MKRIVETASFERGARERGRGGEEGGGGVRKETRKRRKSGRLDEVLHALLNETHKKLRGDSLAEMPTKSNRHVIGEHERWCTQLCMYVALQIAWVVQVYLCRW